MVIKNMEFMTTIQAAKSGDYQNGDFKLYATKERYLVL